MHHSLTVLIPTHGRPALLGRTLESLASCYLPEGYRETVVIENGRPAGAAAVVAESAARHPHLCLRYLHVVHANKSHALNEALATVVDGFVVFFDDDVRLEPGVLEAYAAAAAENPRQTFFGGPTGVDYEVRPPEWLLPFFPPSARGVPYEENGLEIILGFNWAAYAHELLVLGGFNTNYGPGSPTGATGQESEMQRRLTEAGFVRYDVAEAAVWHFVPRERSTKGWLFRRVYRHGLMAALDESLRVSPLLMMGSAFRRGALCALVAVKKAILADEVGLWRALLGVSTCAGQCVGALRQVRRAAPVGYRRGEESLY